MNEPRREAPDVWAVGWWPVRDSSESVLWRPVDRGGWTYRAEGETWRPVERMPPQAHPWRYRHGFADAGGDVFEFPAKGDDVPAVDARPLRRWPMLAPAVEAPPICRIPTDAPAVASANGSQMTAEAAVEPPAVEPPAVAQEGPAVAPYVPPPSTALPPRTSARKGPRRLAPDYELRDRRRREVDAVRAALRDPEDVARRLGLCEGKSRGEGATWFRESGNVKVLCPWHNERTPSCGITRGPDGTLRVHCHSCKVGGDVLHLVAAVHGVDLKARFRDVLAAAAELAGVRLDVPREALPPPRPRAAAPAEHAPDPALVAVAAALLVVAPLDAPDAADVRAYLDARGILAGALADGWGALPSTPDGLARVRREVIAATDEAAWLRSGLAGDDGAWLWPANRVVIPWRDESGALTWLQRRTLGGGDRRYVAPTGAKATAPYGAERLRGAGDAVVAVTEGAVDALALRAACEREGVRAVILGAPGTTWEPAWCPMLAGRDVALAADDDGAGDGFVARIAPDIQRVARSVQRWRPTGAKDWCAAWEAKTG